MRYLLFISEHVVLAYASGRGRFSHGVSFTAGDEGMEQFAQYLDERKDAVFCGVLDAVEEEYQQEQLPGLRKRDARRAMANIVKVKCSDAMLWRSRRKADTTGGNVGLQLHLTTVARETPCQPWLTMLMQRDVLVSELYLLSDLCGRMDAVRDTAVCVVVLAIAPGDYRVFGFLNGLPAITRRFVTGNALAEPLLVEVEKTLSFLTRTSAVSGEAGLTLFLGDASSADREILRKGDIIIKPFCELLPALHNSTRVNAIEFFMYMMTARGRSREHRLAGSYRSAFEIRRRRHGFFAGILCCTACIAASSVAGARMAETFEQLSAATQANAALLDERLAVVHAELEPYHGQIDAMRSAVQIGTRVTRLGDNTPMQLILPLASALSQHPAIRVHAIDWQLQGGMPSSGPPDAVLHILNVTGEIDKSVAGIGELVRGFNRFVAELEATDQINSVEVVESPLGRDGSGSTISPGGSDAPLRFTLSLGAEEQLGE